MATWGNLVNRVLTLTARSFEGVVPHQGDLSSEDQGLLDTIDGLLAEEAGLIERVDLRAGLRAAMQGAQAVNGYLNAQEPWKVLKDDPARAGTILSIALSAIAGLGVGFSPYTPFTADLLRGMLGLESGGEQWRRPELSAGTRLGEITPLFTKLEEL